MNRRGFLITSSAVVGAVAAGSIYWPSRWRYIVIHHSAGSYGSVEFIQKVHRERQAKDPIDAIPYHYLVGNGNGLGMGEIASDYRQTLNVWGAHVSGANPDLNFRGIGICLIGNFEKREVPDKQYDSAVQLTKQLMEKYDISAANVNGHGYFSGERTKCPGKNFPMKKFIEDIA